MNNEEELDAISQEMTDLSLKALLAAGEDDGDGVNDALNTMNEKYGWTGLFGAVVGWFRVIGHYAPLGVGEGERRPATMHVTGIDARTGALISLKEADYPGALVSAMEMMVAVANEDVEGAGAVFRQAVDRGQGHDVVSVALRISVAALAEHLD